MKQVYHLYDKTLLSEVQATRLEKSGYQIQQLKPIKTFKFIVTTIKAMWNIKFPISKKLTDYAQQGINFGKLTSYRYYDCGDIR